MTAPAADYYSTPGRLACLRAAVAHWHGTPFRHNSLVPGEGGGVDCVRLAYAVHRDAGAIDPCDLPSLPLGWHEHHGESGILAFFQQPHVRSRLRLIDRDDPPAEGDLVTVRTGECVHHLGIAVRPNEGVSLALFHVPRGGVAQFWPLAHPALRIAGLWRLLDRP